MKKSCFFITNFVLLRNFGNYEAFKCKNLLIVGFDWLKQASRK